MNNDSNSLIRLNWRMIIPFSLTIFVLIIATSWAIVLAYNDFGEKIIFIILFVILIAIGTKKLVQFKYVLDNNQKGLKSIIKQKIKDEVHHKEFRIALVIEIVSVLAVFVLIGFQEQFPSDFILEILNQIMGIFVIFFLPGYMIFRKLKQDKIKNKANIIFFCSSFMTIGLIISSIAIQTYQKSIPPIVLHPVSPIFPDVDLSLLVFYLAMLPIKVIFAKYSYRIVVFSAIQFSPPGTTTDDNKYPY